VERPSSYHSLGDAVAPYLADEDRVPHAKLSISLPADLLEVVRAAAAERGTTVSATIAASLRHTLADAEQQRLDAALALDGEVSVELAREYAPTAVRLLSDLEW
jgi:plasmid stability protein